MEVAMKLEFDSDDGEDVEHEINSSVEASARSQVETSPEADIDYEERSIKYSSSPELEHLHCLQRPIRSYFHTASCYPHSPPYKRIRALRLFDSPTTPKTLLQKCAADSTSSVSSGSTSTLSSCRSKVHSCRCTCSGNELCKVCIQMVIASTGSKDEANKACKNANQNANINPFTPTGMMLSRKRTRSRRDVKNSEQSDISFASDMNSGIPEGNIASNGNTSLSCGDENDENLEGLLSPSKRLSLHEANVSRYYEEFLEMSMIGQGAFGSVYKCRHRLDGCIYAIKKSLKPVAGSADERVALNEVYAHAVLGKHPHVVRYYSAWAENNHMIIQNEHCNGGSLAELLEKQKITGEKFTELQLKQLLLHLAKGLRYIHSQQLVHMDLKPGNIFLSRDERLPLQGDDSADDGFEEEEELDHDITYKIGDLGHVTSLVNPQVEEGDCRYLPREILHEDFSNLPKADIFALGLTLWEAATRNPLPLNGVDWHALRDGEFADIGHLNFEVKSLLKLMTHPDPRERPTAAQLVNQLTFCPSGNKSHAQLRRELNAEKFKNEILSKKLEEAAKCLKSIDPSLASPSKSGVAAQLTANLRAAIPRGNAVGGRFICNRVGNRKSRARLVGKMATRSSSTTNF